MKNVLVLSGYGINCEKETAEAFSLAGANSEVVHINDLISKKKSLNDFDLLSIPGGFSYGDDTGSGNAMAWKIKLNLWDELTEFVKSKKPVIGICNGFQVLANLGLLPSFSENELGERKVALCHNTSSRYECRWVYLKPFSQKCIWTKGIGLIRVPVAHGEGNFFAEPEFLKKLNETDQVAFRYVNAEGEPANQEFPLNPNGAIEDIAGITDYSGRILGVMPHPERAVMFSNQPDFHLKKEQLKRMGKSVPVYNEHMIQIFENGLINFD